MTRPARAPAAALLFALVVLVAAGCSSSSPARSSSTSTTTAASPPTGGSGTTAGAAGGTPGTTAGAAPRTVHVAIVGPTLPQPISRAVAVTVGDQVELLGGRTVAKVSTDEVVGWRPGGSATVIGHLARRVHDAAAVLIGTRALVFGGGDGGSVANVQAVDGGSGQMVGSLPTGRSDLSAVQIDGTAYVIGGYDDTNGVLDVLATTDGHAFSTLTRISGTLRYGAAVTVGHQALVFGGEAASRSGDAVLLLDPAHRTIQQVATMPLRLSHASAFDLGGQIYVAGGETDGVQTDVIYRYDLATKSFMVVGHLPGVRSDAAVAVVGNTAYLVGGEAPQTLDTVVAVTVS